MPASGLAADGFRPTASWEHLRLRAELLRRLRQFFDSRGFLEVDTPLLSADTVIDRHLDPLRVTLFDDARRPAEGRTLWLQTSPEFAMKRLLAAGATAIYQVTHAFRGGERGRLHNPEFTMAEWYRVGDGLQDGLQLLSDLAETLLARGAADHLTYREAFLQHAGVDPLTSDVRELAARTHTLHLTVPAGLDPQDRDEWLDLLLVECVEPQLGQQRPTILYDYPASQSALARVRDGDPPVAERFELYVRGIELANGYHELLDPAILRQRNHKVNRQRQADGKPMLPEDSQLLAAMVSGLPPCTGVALGFDRLVMVAAGAEDIAAVMTFPVERA
ncbi:MAG: EF-P lysine aminoacylase EpmA [Planctomycetota bacterium]|nr:EF-P lysine aminoacylase EpmA [Planctomycetota bacterium]